MYKLESRQDNESATIRSTIEPFEAQAPSVLPGDHLRVRPFVELVPRFVPCRHEFAEFTIYFRECRCRNKLFGAYHLPGGVGRLVLEVVLW